MNQARLPGARPIVAGVIALTLTVSLLNARPAAATSSFAARTVLGQTDFISNTARSFRSPSGVFIDPAGHLLAADRMNNRVAVWMSLPATNDDPPDYLLGRPPDFLGIGEYEVAADTMRCPVGVWSDGNRVIVADQGNNRVLVFNSFFSAPSNAPDADLALGQPDLASGPPEPADPEDALDLCFPADGRATTASTLEHPAGVMSDGARLLVADSGHHRVAVWHAIPGISGVPADMALGQVNLSADLANRGGAASAATLNLPTAAELEGSRLFVADTFNNRVLVWNTLPAPGDPSGPPADLVLGQPDFSNIGADAAPPSNPLLTDGGRGKPSARSLHGPTGVTAFGDILAVSDHYNSRVMLFRPLPFASFPTAVEEVSHSRFTADFPGISQSLLANPWGISLNSQRLAVGDLANNRVMLYPLPIEPSGAVRATAPAGTLEIIVSWDPVPGASGYRIYRDGFWMTDVSSASTSIIDPKLSPETYTYKVAPLSDSNRLESKIIGEAFATASGTLPPLIVTRHDSYGTYLAEGDSVTSEDGAYAFPEDMYFKQIRTYLRPLRYQNSSVSGSTCMTGGFQARLASNVANLNPDLVTIGIGHNDMVQGYSGTHGARSLAAFRACLEQVIAIVQPSAARTLMLMNFHHMTNWELDSPYVGITGAPDVSLTSGNEAKRRAWARLLRDVAAHAGVPLVDVIDHMDDALARAAAEGSAETFLLGDRVHPNQAGQDVIADAVLDQLLNVLPASSGPALPGRPLTPLAEVSTTQPTAPVGWSWSPSASGADRYELAWSKDASFLVGVNTLQTAASSATVDLDLGKWYARVRGITSSGAPGPWTNWSRVKIVEPPPPPPPDSTRPSPPGQPKGRWGSIQRNRVTIQWAPAHDDSGQIMEYEFCWKGIHEDVRHVPAGCIRTNQTIHDHPTPFTAGVYEFLVRAYDPSGNVSDWSEPGYWVSPFL